MVVGGTFGMDGAHANPARTKRADNRMVRTLGQSDAPSAICRPPSGRCGGTRAPPEWMAKRVRQFDAQRAGRVGPAARRTAGPTLPPPTGATGLDTQARHDREAAAGNTGGARSDGGSGAAATCWNRSSSTTSPSSSYGFRPGRGCREAVRRVEELLSQGHVWCVDCDLKSYFDTIPHERLLGAGPTARRGRQRPGVAGAMLESRRAGRTERLAADRSGAPRKGP